MNSKSTVLPKLKKLDGFEITKYCYADPFINQEYHVWFTYKGTEYSLIKWSGQPNNFEPYTGRLEIWWDYNKDVELFDDVDELISWLMKRKNPKNVKKKTKTN